MYFPEPLGGAPQNLNVISFSRNSWRCCLHTLSCRVRFPIPKRLIMIHLPTHFPPPFSSPCQDQAGSGIQQAHTAEYGVGEGAEEKIGVTLWFLIKIAENRINCKQRGLEGSYQTVVGFGWQNPRAAGGFSLGWEGMEPWQKGKVSSLSASHASPHPHLCCPLDRRASKTSLCPWCSGGESVVAEW